MVATALPASAQDHSTMVAEGADTSVYIPDAPQDVMLTAGTRTGTPAQNASKIGPQFDHLDILQVGFRDETETTFGVSLRLKALDPSQPNSGIPYRFVGFTYGKIDWRVALNACNQQQQAAGAGCLLFRDAARPQFRAVKPLTPAKDGTTIVFTINKKDIFNEERLPAQYGRALTNLYGYTTQTYATTSFLPNADVLGSVSATDRAPDGGFFNAPYVFARGSGGRGAIGLTADDPIRVSNGEATTIVYQSYLHNTGTVPLKVQLDSKDARSDWMVRVPAILEVPAQGHLTFPVILSLPFTHDHGKTATFKVTAQAVDDPDSSAEMELGVFWTDIPQPSAHHNGEEWFHSAPASVQGPDLSAAAPFKQYWMNGIETDPDPDATDEDIPAFFNDYFFCGFAGGSPNPTACSVPPTFRSSWFFPLAPSLLIGLDFRLDKPGQMNLDIVPSLSSPTNTVNVRLLYCDPSVTSTGGGQGGFGANATSCNNYSVELAKGSVSAAFAARTPAQFEVPLTINPAADLLPYKRGANIGISVTLETQVPQNTVVSEPRPVFVTKKARLYLPLIEYHDPIDQAFEEVGVVKIRPLDPFEKPVNPGRAALYRFEIANDDDILHHLALDIQGINKDWASVVGSPIVAVPVGQKANFTLMVRAPDDAQPEERAELFVVAQSQEESFVVALSRLRATIVDPTVQDVPDESGLAMQAAKKSTPGPSVLLDAGAIAMVVLSLARRRPRLR